MYYLTHFYIPIIHMTKYAECYKKYRLYSKSHLIIFDIEIPSYNNILYKMSIWNIKLWF